MITGSCLITTKKPIEQIVAEAPRGRLPLCVVISSTDDSCIDSMVYIKDGKAYSAVTAELVKSITVAEQLRFIRYI